MKRIKEWAFLLKQEGSKSGYLKIIGAILFHVRFGFVAKQEWKQRIQICNTCPIYNKQLRQCKWGELGCGCYVPFLAKTKGSCWGRDNIGGDFGWK